MKNNENKPEKEKKEENFFDSIQKGFLGLFSPPPVKRPTISEPKNVTHELGMESKTDKMFSKDEKNAQLIKEYEKKIGRKEVDKEYDLETFQGLLEQLEPIKELVIALLKYKRKKQKNVNVNVNVDDMNEGIEEKDRRHIKEIADFLIKQGKGAFFFYSDDVMRIRSIQKNLSSEESLQNERKEFQEYKKQVQKEITVDCTFLSCNGEEARQKGLNKELAKLGVCIPHLIYTEWFNPGTAEKTLKKLKKPPVITQNGEEKYLNNKNLQFFLEQSKINLAIQDLLSSSNMKRDEIVTQFEKILLWLQDHKSKAFLCDKWNTKNTTGVQEAFFTAMAKPLNEETQQERIDAFSWRLGLNGLHIPEAILSGYIQEKLSLQKEPEEKKPEISLQEENKFGFK